MAEGVAMTPASRPPKVSVEPLPENLFREPIDCLHADHFRLRVVCDYLERLAAVGAAGDVAQLSGIVLGFLEADFLLHVADEEADLLMLLRARGWPEAASQSAVLDRLIDEHRRDDELRLRLVPELRRIASGQAPERPIEFAQTVEEFVGSLRQHLAWEESTILQEARRRLAAADLEVLGRHMADRRGISFPEI